MNNLDGKLPSAFMGYCFSFFDINPFSENVLYLMVFDLIIRTSVYFSIFNRLIVRKGKIFKC